jgi:hypothetical protein
VRWGCGWGRLRAGLLYLGCRFGQRVGFVLLKLIDILFSPHPTNDRLTYSRNQFWAYGPTNISTSVT